MKNSRLKDTYYHLMRAKSFPAMVRFVLLVLCLEKAKSGKYATFSSAWLVDVTGLREAHLDKTLEFLLDTGVLTNVRQQNEYENTNHYTIFYYELNLRRVFPN